MKSVVQSVIAVVILALLILAYVQRDEIQDLRQENAELRADVATTKGAIALQNERVTQMEIAARVFDEKSSLAAVRTLNESKARPRAIETDGAGPEGMNRWLQETFSVSR